MSRRRRLTLYYFGTLGVFLIVFTVAYDIGMTVFEGRPRGPIHSFEVVLQTLTPIGYGEDAPWASVQMQLLVIVMQFSAILLVFAALPVFVIPLFENVFTRSPPTAVDEVDDHVIVCGSGERTVALLDELTARGLDHAVIAPDRDDATEFDDQGYRVVFGEYGDEATLEKAGIPPTARALVVDIDDEVNLSVIIAAKIAAPSVPVYSLVNDPAYRDYHAHAGADEVFSPRTLLGQGLATKVTTTVSVEVEEIVGADRPTSRLSDLQIGELPVDPASDLAGERLDVTDIEARFGGTVIGAWVSGEFLTQPFSGLRLDEHTTLLAIGQHHQMRQLERLLQSEARTPGTGRVIILGHGAVGSTGELGTIGNGHSDDRR